MDRRSAFLLVNRISSDGLMKTAEVLEIVVILLIATEIVLVLLRHRRLAAGPSACPIRPRRHGPPPAPTRSRSAIAARLAVRVPHG